MAYMCRPSRAKSMRPRSRPAPRPPTVVTYPRQVCVCTCGNLPHAWVHDACQSPEMLGQSPEMLPTSHSPSTLTRTNLLNTNLLKTWLRGEGEVMLSRARGDALPCMRVPCSPVHARAVLSRARAVLSRARSDALPCMRVHCHASTLPCMYAYMHTCHFYTCTRT